MSTENTEQPSGGGSLHGVGRQEPEATKHKINPAYLKASHVVLWCCPGAPSFDDQLAHDAEVQEQLEKKLREQGGGDSLPTDAR